MYIFFATEFCVEHRSPFSLLVGRGLASRDYVLSSNCSSKSCPSYSRYSCVFRLLRGASAPPRGWSVRLGGGEGVGPLFPKGCAAVAYCMWLPDFACCCSPPRGWAAVAFGLASTITGFQLGPWFAIRHPAFHQCSDPRGWAVSVGHNHRLRWWCRDIPVCRPCCISSVFTSFASRFIFAVR